MTEHAHEPEHQRDDAQAWAVERMAVLLTEQGIPRMMARVFAFALVDDADRYTASELAEGIRVSQAAISGAVRPLVHMGLLDRVREPGARSDHYRLYDEDVWSAIMLQRGPLLERWEQATAEAMSQLPEGPGRRRLNETREFMAYMRTELPNLVKRWQEHRAQLHTTQTGAEATPATPEAEDRETH
ncbi:MarR family transcriptional regulator [Lipingzhangella sp. LS1_29]|uniref:MarR family transcriptional regulator n=1 Tax=Lipingzhangella rawalii TaxID=2055835 RepID=A0ABU2H5J0_9ACTN|nr:MarR family transcriptional regulator [Lipingzhangella rawalii]MDS1269884.1 MarR family transcriptional regulator [Lipingzhangella rawalii]